MPKTRTTTITWRGGGGQLHVAPPPPRLPSRVDSGGPHFLYYTTQRVPSRRLISRHYAIYAPDSADRVKKGGGWVGRGGGGVGGRKNEGERRKHKVRRNPPGVLRISFSLPSSLQARSTGGRGTGTGRRRPTPGRRRAATAPTTYPRRRRRRRAKEVRKSYHILYRSRKSCKCFVGFFFLKFASYIFFFFTAGNFFEKLGFGSENSPSGGGGGGGGGGTAAPTFLLFPLFFSLSLLFLH